MHTDTMGCYLIRALLVSFMSHDSEDNLDTLQSVLFVVSPFPFFLSTTIIAFTSTMIVNIVISITCQLVPSVQPPCRHRTLPLPMPPITALPSTPCTSISHLSCCTPLLLYLVPMNLNTQLRHCHVIGPVIMFQAQIYNGHCVIHGSDDAATADHVYH